MYSGDKIGQPKLCPAILEFALRAPGFPSQSNIHRQPSVYLHVVLNVETGKGVAHKSSGRVVSETKSAVDSDLLNGLYGLVGQAHSQIGNADGIGCRTSACFLAGIAKPGIVEKVRTEDMALVQQDVL